MMITNYEHMLVMCQSKHLSSFQFWSTFFPCQVIHAARTLAAHPVSKIAQENMEVFVDVWEAQVEELGKVLRLITAGGDPSKSK